MKKYKFVKDEYILGIGENLGTVEVTEEEYLKILSIIKKQAEREKENPVPDGYVYMLRDSTLEYELVELQPEEPEADEEVTE